MGKAQQRKSGPSHKPTPGKSKSSTSSFFDQNRGAIAAVAFLILALYFGLRSTASRPISARYGDSVRIPSSSLDAQSVPTVDDDDELPAGFTAPRRPVQADAPTVRSVQIHTNGGNYPVGVMNVTEENFRTLGTVYNRQGQVVKSFETIGDDARLWHGPPKAGLHYMWPGISIGQRVTVPGLNSPSGKAIHLETLATGDDDTPRVFYVHNFLANDEAQQLIDFSTAAKNPYKMAPSTAGTEKSWNQGGAQERHPSRTSMNAFDISTQNSRNIKERVMKLLRLSQTEESMLDGIQILRYEVGQAYVAHEDYFQTHQSKDHNWAPSKGGSNRFATVFLYLSDVELGGQTVFSKVPRTHFDELTNTTKEQMLEALGPKPDDKTMEEWLAEAKLKRGTWEHTLTKQCFQDSFAIPPRKGDAILFYSQTPTGILDIASTHGACPVIRGIKWAANVWVWNACRWSLCKHAMNPAQELPPLLKAQNGPMPWKSMRRCTKTEPCM